MRADEHNLGRKKDKKEKESIHLYAVGRERGDARAKARKTERRKQKQKGPLDTRSGKRGQRFTTNARPDRDRTAMVQETRVAKNACEVRVIIIFVGCGRACNS